MRRKAPGHPRRKNSHHTPIAPGARKRPLHNRLSARPPPSWRPRATQAPSGDPPRHRPAPLSLLPPTATCRYLPPRRYPQRRLVAHEPPARPPAWPGPAWDLFLAPGPPDRTRTRKHRHAHALERSATRFSARCRAPKSAPPRSQNSHPQRQRRNLRRHRKPPAPSRPGHGATPWPACPVVGWPAQAAARPQPPARHPALAGPWPCYNMPAPGLHPVYPAMFAMPVQAQEMGSYPLRQGCRLVPGQDCPQRQAPLARASPARARRRQGTSACVRAHHAPQQLAGDSPAARVWSWGRTGVQAVGPMPMTQCPRHCAQQWLSCMNYGMAAS